MTPTVTAVIPAYCAAEFLADAIRSVLAQTVPLLECLVIDDGSTDDTAAVARSFEGSGTVRVISTPNRGVALARNTALTEARGDFLAFLDADDAWLPDKTARQLDALARCPVAVAAYGSIVLADAKLRPERELPAPAPEEAMRSVVLLQDAVPSLAQTGMVVTDVFRRLGGFEPSLSTSADADLLCRLAAEGPLVRVDGPVTLYRQHGAQMHHDLAAFEHDASLLFVRIFESGLASPDLARPARAALHRILAKAYLLDRRPGGALTHAVRALVAAPSTTAADLTRSLARRVAGRPGPGQP